MFIIRIGRNKPIKTRDLSKKSKLGGKLKEYLQLLINEGT